MKFECVSKQWKRFIFNKQLDINIEINQYMDRKENTLNALIAKINCLKLFVSLFQVFKKLFIRLFSILENSY